MSSSEVPVMAQEWTEVSNTLGPALLLFCPGAASKCFQATKNLAQGWLLGSTECAWPPQGIREKAERRKAAHYERLWWNPPSIFAEPKVLGCQAFEGSRWATGTRQVPEKVSGQAPSRKVSCQGKAVGWSSAGGMGAGKSLRVGL